VTNNIQRILITGGTGYVGKVLCKYLSQKKYHVTLLVRRKPEIEYFDNIFFFKEPEDIKKNYFFNIDAVVHLAGNSHDTSNKDNFEKYIKTNVALTKKIINICVDLNVSKFIYISSVKACGVDGKKCSNEITQILPIDSYGLSKLEAEKVLLRSIEKANTKLTILRPALIYGPKPKGNLKLLEKSIYYGLFPPLPKINNKRSMIHIDDVIRGISFFLFREDKNGEIYNLTDGKDYSTYDIYSYFMGYYNKKIPSWHLKIGFLNFLCKMSSGFRHKISKLLSSECYSNEKLTRKGFIPKKDLSKMHETSF